MTKRPPKAQANSRKVALITGAAQRIGKSIATVLHQRGIDIAIHCNQSTTQAQQLALNLNECRANSAYVFKADLSKSTAAKQLVSQSISQFGRLDYLVNNASIFYPKSLSEQDYEASLAQFCGINFDTPVAIIREAQPYLAKNEGAILNLIDIYANSGLVEHTAYVASKSALKQATKQLAIELAPRIRINGISPGAILWPESAATDTADVTELAQQKQQAIIDNTALKRKGRAEDISATAVFLLLDASYVTGITIAVDGGRQLYI
jgi:pteridine reductase